VDEVWLTLQQPAGGRCAALDGIRISTLSCLILVGELPEARRGVQAEPDDAGESKKRSATGALLVTLRELVAVGGPRKAVDERDAVVRLFALLGHAGSLFDDLRCRQPS